MNELDELDELVYAMEDLNLSEEEIKIFMNKGEIGGPQGKIEEGDGSNSIKEEWQEPEMNDKNFANKAKKNKDYIKHYHNDNKAKFMPNRLPTGDIGTQFLDLDCKRDPETNLDLWSQNILLYFLSGKGSYTDEEKYIIMINTFIGKVSDWFSGLIDDAVKIIKNDTLEGLKNSLQEGITNLKQYIANEFFGGQGSSIDNREKIRTIAKEQLEKLQIYKMSYIQEYTCNSKNITINYLIAEKKCYHILKNTIKNYQTFGQNTSEKNLKKKIKNETLLGKE